MPRKIPPELQCKCPTCGADSNMFVCQSCNELKPWHNGGTDGLECDECWKGDTMEHLAKLTERIPAKDALDIETVVKRIVANAVAAALSPVNAELYKTQATLTDVRGQLKREAALAVRMTIYRDDRNRYHDKLDAISKLLGLTHAINSDLDPQYLVNAVNQLLIDRRDDRSKLDNLRAELDLVHSWNSTHGSKLNVLASLLGINEWSRDGNEHEVALNKLKATSPGQVTQLRLDLSEARLTITEREKCIDQLRAVAKHHERIVFTLNDLLHLPVPLEDIGYVDALAKRLLELKEADQLAELRLDLLNNMAYTLKRMGYPA